MNKRKNRITAILNAVTFAEAGEHDKAIEFLGESPSSLAASQTTAPDQAPQQTRQCISLRDIIERGLAAITFAEAGETATAEEFMVSTERRKTVLLAIEGDTANPAAVDYALSVCERLQAQLDVLLVGERKGRAHELAIEHPEACVDASQLQHLAEKVERSSIPIRVTAVSGPVSQELSDYTRQHKEVGFVVMDSAMAHSDPSEAKRWTRLVDKLSQRIGIPLVTVRQRAHAEALS